MSPIVLLALGAAAFFALSARMPPNPKDRWKRCHDEKMPGMLLQMADWLLVAPLGAEMLPDIFPGSGEEGPVVVTSAVVLDMADSMEKGGYPKMAKCLRERALELAAEESAS